MGTEINIFVVSDSIGETAEQVAKAAISQFEIDFKNIKRYSYINSVDQIENIINKASLTKSVILFTLVVNELRNYMIEKAKEKNIQAIDLLGPILNSIEKVIGFNPKGEPGIIRKLDEKYFRKVEAVEFAVKYDDGKDVRGIKKADIVLIGISRTSKTPLSMYLAHKNIKVANIPLVPEVEPPKELFEIDNKKIIGLTANPIKLNEIRQERLRALGLSSKASYASMDRILEEIEYAEKIMMKLGCKIIDVSVKAVEETAGIILEMIKNGK